LKKLLAPVFIIALIISIFSQCAKIVAPTGGPKDTLAPILIRSVPEMNTLNFKGEKLTLYFNEYIVLKDIQKKLAISPPMTKKPELNQRGKNFEVKFKEPLKDSTTYSFYFADGIADNNEGNPLKNFVFAFSTGNIIDSLVVTGVIKNALTLLPEENAFIMLYDKENDSLPIKELPRYLTRSDKHGFFTFKNLQESDYKVFALIDNNSNYKFDQVTEDIAFLNESLKKDVLKGPSRLDTSRHARREISLNMFKENNRIQALTGFARSQRRKIGFAFTKKPEGRLDLNPLNFTVDSNWYIKETNQYQDSLICWITDDRINAMDTLKVQLSYLKSDSLQQLKPKLDTIKFIYTDIVTPRKRKGEKDNKEVKKVILKVNSSIANNQTVTPIKPLVLSFPIPLKRVNDSLIILTYLKDSSKVSDVKLVKDSLNPLIYRFSYNWATDVSYYLQALPGAFTSLDGIKNDTLKLKFKGANPENYGVLNISLLSAKKGAIVELLDEKRTQVIEHYVAKPGEKVIMNFINPGKYTLRFIEDSNANGVWDTGWYLKGIQPERVINYVEGKTKGVLNIRANWENEITFDFGK
jgi:hypothetical protein